MNNSTALHRDSMNIVNDFRVAMRLMPSSVYVVTSRDHRGQAGMTATAVSSLSFDPVSMLVCVNRSATLFETITNSSRFALNLLSSCDISIADDFGRSSGREERFRSGEWDELDSLPVLKSAVSSIVCDIAATSDFGTHRILVGSVTAVRHNRSAVPLLYADGGFAGAHRLDATLS